MQAKLAGCLAGWLMSMAWPPKVYLVTTSMFTSDLQCRAAASVASGEAFTISEPLRTTKLGGRGVALNG